MAFWYLNFKSQTWLKCDDDVGQIEFSTMQKKRWKNCWNLDFVHTHESWSVSEHRENPESHVDKSLSRRASGWEKREWLHVCGMIFITFGSNEMRMSQRHEWNSSLSFVQHTFHIRLYIITLIFSGKRKVFIQLRFKQNQARKSISIVVSFHPCWHHSPSCSLNSSSVCSLSARVRRTMPSRRRCLLPLEKKKSCIRYFPPSFSCSYFHR